MSVIGDNIRALRKREGLTQEQFAAACGFTRETVNKWETGAIGEVRASNVETIRNVFHLSFDDLRSRSHGLAAQIAGAVFHPADATIPLVTAKREAVDVVEVTHSLAAEHPGAFAVDVSDDMMSHVLPTGSLAIVDPDLEGKPGDIVLADDPAGGPSPILRRLTETDDGLCLVSDSYRRHEEHFIRNIRGFKIHGTLIWYQPKRSLGSERWERR